MFNVVIDPLQTPAPLVTVAMSNKQHVSKYIADQRGP